jgi:hypothetical protein
MKKDSELQKIFFETFRASHKILSKNHRDLMKKTLLVFSYAAKVPRKEDQRQMKICFDACHQTPCPDTEKVLKKSHQRYFLGILQTSYSDSLEMLRLRCFLRRRPSLANFARDQYDALANENERVEYRVSHRFHVNVLKHEHKEVK